MRERLQVPREQEEAFKLLVGLDSEKRASLLKAIRTAKTNIHEDVFGASIAASAGIPPNLATEVADVLFSLYVSEDRFGYTLEQFLQRVAEAGVTANVKPPEGDWAPFKDWLRDVLALHSTLGVSAKGSEIAAAFPNSFCSARVISDLRPVFSKKASSGPEAAVVVHQLRLTFHPDMGRDHEHFYLALDREDLSLLKGSIDRAIEKDSALRTRLEEAKLNVLEN
jgi:hypothetical protein